MWAKIRAKRVSPRVCVPANEVSDLIFLLCAPQNINLTHARSRLRNKNHSLWLI